MTITTLAVLVLLSQAVNQRPQAHYSHGTCLALIVTHDAIVVGADSKTTITNSDNAHLFGSNPKIFLLPNGVAMGSVGLSTFGWEGQIYYDQQQWIEETGRELHDTASVANFAQKVNAKAALLSVNLNQLLKLGIITPEGFRNPIVSFAIAGYDAGSPVIYLIELKANWEHGAMAPPNLVLTYPRGVREYPYLLFLGSSTAAKEIQNKKGRFYEKALAAIPDELQVLYEKRDFSIPQAANLLRTIIGLESEANPQAVGLPVRIITVPKNGTSTVTPQ